MRSHGPWGEQMAQSDADGSKSNPESVVTGLVEDREGHRPGLPIAHDQSGQEALSLVPEVFASALTGRISRRCGLTEFRESAVVPHVDPFLAESKIRQRIDTLLSEVSQTRRSLQQLRQRLLSLQRKIHPLLFAAIAFSVTVLAFAIVELIVPSKNIADIGKYYPPLEPRSRILAILLMAIVIVAASVFVRRWLRRDSQIARQIAGIAKHELALTEQLETRLDFEVDRLLRLDANERGERQGVLVLTPQAPDLVELETAEPTNTPDIRRLRELVINASTSAFAIAGPRGIGKSTLVRALASDRKLFDLATVVPAPVRYDPDALLRRIHSDLARAILKRYGAEDVLIELQQSVDQRIRSRRLRIARAALLAGFLLFILNMLQLPILGSIGSAGALGILLAFVAYITIVNLKTTRAAPDNARSAVVQNAVEALESLRWSTEATQTAKTSFTAAKILVGLEDTDSSTRKERDWSRPERIAELISFIRRHLTLTRQSMADQAEEYRVAIAVDELDKIPDPNEILDTINSLKDLFRIPGVHFLVSVSSDAMTRFALRGVVSRDAFDSSFDAVIELHRLTAEEAHKILSGRAIGFPASLSAVCHAWSGGLPRDLIRVARRCVELRRNTGITSIDQLAASIIAEDTALTLMALRITDYAGASGHEEVPSRLSPLIDDLTRHREAPLTTSELSEVLSRHINICGSPDPSVRATATKLLVSSGLTLAFAAALAQSNGTMNGTQAFALADELANVSALQSEPLGETLAVARKVLEHMWREKIYISVDLSLIVTSGVQLSGRDRDTWGNGMISVMRKLLSMDNHVARQWNHSGPTRRSQGRPSIPGQGGSLPPP